MRFCLIFLLFCSLPDVFFAETFTVAPAKGVGSIEHCAVFRVVHQGTKGAITSQRHQAFPQCGELSADSRRYRGEWKFPEHDRPVRFDIEYRIGENGNLAKLDYRFEAAEAVASRMFALQLELPAAEFAGRPVAFDGSPAVLPGEHGQYLLLRQEGVRRIELPLREGSCVITPSRPISVALLDLRKDGQSNFVLNLSFLEPGAESFVTAELSFDFHALPGGLTPLQLEAAANSQFADRYPDDRQGGWTDQGSLLDLRALPPGRLETPYGAFHILGDGENGGKSCVVLGGGVRSYLPSAAEQPLNGEKIQTLALLHGLAWPAAGEAGFITVRFMDGGEQRIPLRMGRDAGNWWNPSPIPNGSVVWKMRNDENDVGLYLSFFHLPVRPVRSLRFESGGRSVWMIAGIAGSERLLSLPRQSEYVFTRDDQWRPFVAERSILENSALDFSFLLDAPAGKYGFLEVRDGKFKFEKRDTPFRFYGANLCGLACYLEPRQADQLAERLSRVGYNAVRFHHYDRDYVRGGIDNSVTVDPAQRGKLEYLIAALKKRGIYISIDLFSLRTRIPGEFASLPKLRDMKGYKLAAMLVPEVNANLKAFAREVLTHVNPYTGLPLAADPVLIGVVGINENMIISLYEDCTWLSPDVTDYYNREFERRCREKKIPVTEENRREHFRRFLYEVYGEYWADMVKFLRGLGVRAPLSDQNHRQPPLAYVLREKYDYVDCHIYWDHPQWIGPVKWKHPAQIRNTSSLAGAVWPIRMLGPSRLLDKPFTVSEFDFCYPNEFRAEGAVLMGAYAAFQDWDGLFRFEYSGSPNSLFDKPYLSSFGVVNDPVRLLSERIGMAFFVRGDLAAAETVLPVAVKPGEFERNYVEAYSDAAQRLTFLARTGSVAWRNGVFSPPLPAGSAAVYPESSAVELPAGVRRFDEAVQKDLKTPRQVRLDLKAQTFAAVTPKSEALVIPAGKSLAGDRLSARSVKGFGVVSAISLDGRDLAESERMLLLHLTDLRAEGVRYLSLENKVILADAPRENEILGRRGVMEAELAIVAGPCRLYALDHSGTRLGEIPVRSTNGKLQVTLDTFAVPGNVVFAYELVRSL